MSGQGHSWAFYLRQSGGLLLFSVLGLAFLFYAGIFAEQADSRELQIQIDHLSNRLQTHRSLAPIRDEIATRRAQMLRNGAFPMLQDSSSAQLPGQRDALLATAESAGLQDLDLSQRWLQSDEQQFWIGRLRAVGEFEQMGRFLDALALAGHPAIVHELRIETVASQRVGVFVFRIAMP